MKKNIDSLDKLDWETIIEGLKRSQRKAKIIQQILNWAIVFSVGFLLAICLTY